MRIQRNKVAWAEIKFESNIQSTQIYKEWVEEVLVVRNMSDILSDASVGKAVDVSPDIFITRSHADLEFLISRWSMETHTFFISWGEFTSTLEDVSVMFRLPVLADTGTMALALSNREKEKAKILNAALRLSSKSIYTSRARYCYF